MKSKKVTVTKNYLDGLKSDRDKYKKEKEKIEFDRSKHRFYYLGLLKSTLSILGRGQSVDSEWLAKDLAKHMNNVESWYW